MDIFEKIKQKIFRKRKKIRGKVLQLNPDVYWLAVLYGMFVIFIASCFFGYYLFLKSSEESKSLPNKSLLAEKIKKERLEKTLYYFKIREEKSSQIINSPAPIVDPSI
jgi:hypothetical protein